MVISEPPRIFWTRNYAPTPPTMARGRRKLEAKWTRATVKSRNPRDDRALRLVGMGMGMGHTELLSYIFYTPNGVSVPISENTRNARARVRPYVCGENSTRCTCGAKRGSKWIAMRGAMEPTRSAWARAHCRIQRVATHVPSAVPIPDSEV